MNPADSPIPTTFLVQTFLAIPFLHSIKRGSDSNGLSPKNSLNSFKASSSDINLSQKLYPVPILEVSGACHTQPLSSAVHTVWLVISVDLSVYPVLTAHALLLMRKGKSSHSIPIIPPSMEDLNPVQSTNISAR